MIIGGEEERGSRLDQAGTMRAADHAGVTLRAKVWTLAGLAVFAAAPLVLLVFAGPQVATSADAEAPRTPLAAIVASILAGLLLVRLRQSG